MKFFGELLNEFSLRTIVLFDIPIIEIDNDINMQFVYTKNRAI